MHSDSEYTFRNDDELNALDEALNNNLNESTEEFNIYKKLVGDDLAREIVAFWDISDPHRYRDGDLDWESAYFQDMTLEDLIYNIEMDVENAEDILARDEDLKLLGGPEFEGRLDKEVKVGKELIAKLKSLTESEKSTKINETIDEKAVELRREIYDTLDDERIPYERVYVYQEGDELLADVTVWGDWKHDHLHCDGVMSRLGFDYGGEDVVEEDGSDCYSAVRHYRYEDNWRRLLSLAKEREQQKRFQ